MVSKGSPIDLLVFRPTLGQGGADRVTVTLLRELDRRRFRPLLVLLRSEGELRAELPPDVPVEVLGQRRLRWAGAALRRLVDRLRPNVLFSTSSGANITAALACGGSTWRPRLVLSERSGLVRERGPLDTAGRVLLKRFLYRRADCVTAVSEGVRGDLIRRLHLPPDRVRAVYSPIVTPEMEALCALSPGDEWLEGDLPVILGAGRLEPVKDFPTLLRAFHQVRSERQCRLLILGEGSRRRDLERLADQLGVRGDTRFLGFVRNPFCYMARCTVFVSSSRFEGLPGALIQSMACGAPAVSTRARFGPEEVIEHGRTGMLVPVGEPEKLASAILHLLDHPGDRADMAHRGRDAVQRFSLEGVLPLYEEALLGERSSKSAT